MFGLLFLGDGATIYSIPLLNILVSGKNIPLAVLELVDLQGHSADGGKRVENLYELYFLITFKKLILISQS